MSATVREFEIVTSKVMNDSDDPQVREVYIEAYGRSGDTKPDETNYKIAMGSFCFETDTGDVYFWEPDDAEWSKFGGGSDS